MTDDVLWKIIGMMVMDDYVFIDERIATNEAN